MTRLEFNRRMAFVCGVGAPVLQLVRALLWGYWPPPRQLPIDGDAYLAGAFLVAAALTAARRPVLGRGLLAAGWGFGCGLLYRSLFEQLADPSRHAGHEVLVMALKATFLAFAAAGVVGAVRATADDA